MAIEQVGSQNHFIEALPNEYNNKIKLPKDEDSTFGDMLKNFISDVNSLQLQSKDQTERFIKGEAVDLHDVMIASEKAKTSFDLLMEIRNKAIDLYREISRLQV